MMREKFKLWRGKFFTVHTWVGLLVLFLASVFDLFVGRYVDSQVYGQSLHDTILDVLPVLHLSFFSTTVFLVVMLVYFLYPTIYRPEKAGWVFLHTGLLILIRNITIALTHMPLPDGALPLVTPLPFMGLAFSHDLLFSGHVAMPFLGYLLYRGEKLGTFFLYTAFVMGAVVLFMHMHYSIDVWSAFFFTYGSFRIGERLFHHFKVSSVV
jgi:hypothetical protein